MKYIILLTFFISIYFINKRKKYKTTAQYKGEEGEKQVSKILHKLSNKKYIVIDDIMIKTNTNLKNTQIDHIVLSIYGIFIVETKNYGGIISGSKNSEHWYQKINGRVIKFRNPLKQNYAHIIGLKKILNLHSYCFINLAAFSNNCTLDLDNESQYNTIHFESLLKFIKSYKQILISEDDMHKMKDVIYRYNIQSSKARKKHAMKVQNVVNSEKGHYLNCPLCGAKMIKRKGKFGYFLGCSNFPKCRFTSSL